MKNIIFFLALTLSACTNRGDENLEDLKEIKEKMGIQEVHLIMRASPLTIETAYWSDTLLVESYESSTGESDHYKIIYLKRDSTVVDVQFGD